ncbi:MAG TPA: hypothetical protein VIM21_04300, partial [Gemmatimonadaceae bacterium]
MHAEFLVLRFVHIVFGIVWVGSGVFTAFFLIPALAANRQLMPAVMEGLQRRRMFIIVPTAGLLTILAGVRLLWIDSAGFAESYMQTGPGRTFSVGGTAAIIALLLQVFVSIPAGVKLGVIAAQLAASPPANERDRLSAEAERLRRRNGMGTLGAVLFGLFAASAMAIARYVCLLILSLAIFASAVDAQSLVNPTLEMHWRHIGPFRAGRGRAVAGVPSQPNTFYISFDNGGIWRSTDFGSNWFPLFDDQPTGSIGAIAVAPSDPNIIYVGSGAGIIRPDLATGDGMYKSTDAGKTWTHLGLRNSQMIAYIEVDPKNSNRLFVAALGHPYGPNEERGIFRSTDGGQTFEKVLYKDEYTSGNDVRIDPANPNIVYATLWQQQQSFIEGQGFGGAANGVFKSTDGGTTWNQLINGLPGVIQANIAIAPSNSKVIYALAATATPTNSVTGVVN